MITNINIGRYGRLGNQLYQLAACFTTAKRLETELWIPAESQNYNTTGRYNPVIGQSDKYNNDLFRLFDLKFVQKKSINEIEKKIEKYYIEKPEVKYYEDFWNIEDGTSLHGYFQAKQYVDKYEKELREELKLNSEYFDYGYKIIENLSKNHNRVVSLHIRRGDLTMDNHMFNAELSFEKYYKKIIDENTNIDDIILIFSDDIDWCKTQFDQKNILFIDNRISEFSHLKDFSLMSMCDVNIMAVSTFSWWASWLNPLSKDKLVFKPKKWWGYSLQNNSEEIYNYDNWITYDNK